MQDNLKVAIIQSDLVWEQTEQNRELFAEKIKQVREAVDIIILPEMFTSGFTMNPSRIAETMQGKTVQWMKKIASKSNAAICGSFVILENDTYFNRFLFVAPDGNIEYYNKRHTFTLAGESEVYKAGNEKIIITYKGWRLCPLICYDLRFPVWARNTENYDALIYVANWPKPRIEAWDTLLKARAIENMSYCVGVNRIGFDDNNHEYTGHSAVYDGLGKQLISLEDGKEGIEIVSLNKEHLTTIRNNLKFLDDKDYFTVE
jgi:predicted amidohydrolase